MFSLLVQHLSQQQSLNKHLELCWTDHHHLIAQKELWKLKYNQNLIFSKPVSCIGNVLKGCSWLFMEPLEKTDAKLLLLAIKINFLIYVQQPKIVWINFYQFSIFYLTWKVDSFKHDWVRSVKGKLKKEEQKWPVKKILL